MCMLRDPGVSFPYLSQCPLCILDGCLACVFMNEYEVGKDHDAWSTNSQAEAAAVLRERLSRDVSKGIYPTLEVTPPMSGSNSNALYIPCEMFRYFQESLKGQSTAQIQILGATSFNRGKSHLFF